MCVIKKIRKPPVLILLLIAALTASNRELAAAPPPGMPEFSGIVVDAATRERLVGATIMIQDKGAGTFSQTDGGFSLKGLVRGDYLVVVRFIGYSEKRIALHLDKDISMTIELHPESVSLPEISVLGDAASYREKSSVQPVTVLTPSELNRVRGQTLGETLENVPGLALLQTGPSIAKPVIRGLHSQRVKVINAGVAQEGQQWGGEHAPEIDPFDAERIEILKGAAGIEYGPGALGGVIRIEPGAYPSGFGIQGDVALNGFLNNMQGAASVHADGRHAALPAFAWRLHAGVRRAGDARTSDYVIGNSGFFEWNASAGGEYRIGPLALELSQRRFETELGIYRGSHLGNYDDLTRAITLGRPPVEYQFTWSIAPPKQNISHDVSTVTADYSIRGIGSARLQLSRQVNHRQEFDVHKRWFDSTATATLPAFDLTLTTYSGDLSFKHHPLAGLTGALGISASRQTNIGQSLSFLIPNYRLHMAGVYAREELSSGRWTFEAGGRLDGAETRVYRYVQKNIPDRTITNAGISGVLGARIVLTEDFSASIALSTAWRPPGVNELYSDGVHHGTAQYEIGDPSLRPERALTADLTLRYESIKAKLELSAWTAEFEDFISIFPDPQPTLTLRGMFPTIRYRQADAVMRGLETTAAYSFFHWYRAELSASIVRGKNSSDGSPLFLIPADRLRIAQHFHLPRTGVFKDPYMEIASLLVNRQTEVPADVDYLPPPPGYVLIDAEIGAIMDILGTDIDLSISIKNILNESYRDYLSRFRYYIDDPGRDLILRIRVPFESANSDAVHSGGVE